MTAAQLARRHRLTSTVIEMIDQGGPERLQMRDVAERSGVALGTTYRYFSSRDHLLAAAWVEWQRRLTDRVRVETGHADPGAGDGGGREGDGDRAGACRRVLGFLDRELRAFQGHPNFARLVAYVEASPDPFACAELAARAGDNADMLAALMGGVPAEVVPTATIAINATLGAGLTSWTVGRITFADLRDQVEAVTRLVLGPYDTAQPGAAVNGA
ncbi:TetR family transcriptional regulator [Frankia sp. AgB32]|nr:TetR family transcriptional regulator [Frankia sp. AgB32]